MTVEEVTDRITAATDGSRLGHPVPGGLGPGGWGWVTDRERCDSGSEPSTTNNRMELTAVRELLCSHPTEPLLIQLDSTYVMKTFTEWLPQWRRQNMRRAGGKPIKNLDLIEEIDGLLTGRDIKWQWVRGHAGHALNEVADRLARSAAKRAKRVGDSRPSDTLAEAAGRLTVATAGARVDCPGPDGRGAGGWGWVTDRGHCDSGGEPDAEEYRMQLTAVLEFLNTNPTEPLLILPGSVNVKQVFTEWLPQWRRQNMRRAGGKRIKNLDLIEEIDRLSTGRDIEWGWVRGHDLNATAGRLAKRAAQSQCQPEQGR